MIRILVTGSRDWPDREAVSQVLNETAEQYGRITVVHGACPSGADLYACQWVTAMRVIRSGHTEEKHPADWERLGKHAGPIRNQQMVNAGAALCIAFPYGKSPGTRDCMHRAKLSGIRVIDLGTDRPNPTWEEAEGLW